MKKSTSWLLLIGLLLSDAIHAEGGCPPGMIPYRGTDLGSCGPVPPGYYNSQQQQQPPQPPPPQWADRWGAIATDSINGILGTITNASNQNQAKQMAMIDCKAKGGTQCKIEASYHNQCIAMIVGHPGYAISAGITSNEAMQKGMKMCVDGGDTNCHTYYTACSLPARIQ